MLEENGIPALCLTDGFPGHKQDDADGDDIRHEKEDVADSAEGVASVYPRVTRVAPCTADDVADKANEKYEID